MVNLLSRVYNSTLGVPQQALYRMWRALKDEDIDVFSREGILAPELLPGIGIVFDHETDVQIEELVGDQGGFGNFLIDTALDPATYATLGASALGKVGRAVNMARNPKRAAGAKFSQYVGDLAQYETNADLAAKIAQGLGEGAIEGKHAQRALAELSGDFKGTTLMETLGASKQEEAVLTLPGLARMGAVWRAPDIVQNQGGWYRAMHNLFYNQRTGLRRPIDWTLTQATNGVRQLGPWGNTAADAMLAIGGIPSTFMKGFKTKKGAAQLLNLAADTPTKAADFQTEFGDLAGKYAKTDPDQLATDIDAALAEGLDEGEAILKAARKQGISGKAVEGLLGVADETKSFTENVRDLQTRASEASAALEEGKILPEAVRRYNVPPEFADHELRAWAWKAGDVAGRLVRKGFRSDAPIESGRLEDLNRDRRDLEGMTQLAATSTVKKFTALKKRIAKDNGTDLETVNRAHLGWMQMFPHSSEFRVNLEALQSGDLSRAEAASRQLDEFTNRYRSSLEAVRQYAGVKSLEDLSKFLDATDVKRIVGPEAEHTMLRAKDVNNSKEVADLLRKPVGELDPNDIRRLRGQVKDPVTRARLVNMENRKRKGKTFNAAELPARVVGKATVAGKPVNGELPSAFADYLLATRDVKRALSRSRKEGGPPVIAPGTIARLDRAEAAMQEGARTLAREAFPKARQEDLDELFAISGKVADAAMDVRTFERGAPLAYVPRISDRRFREKLGKVIGKANRVLGAPAEVDSMFRRVQQRDLTIEDLNELKETLLKENHPDIWKEVEDLVGPDLKLRPYVESYETGLLQQMTQQGAAVSTKRFIDDFFSNPEAAAKDGVVGGRITRIFDGEAQEITSGDKLKVSGKKRADVREVPIAQDTTPAYVELQLPNGQYQILDATQFKDRGLTLHALGKEGETLGDAVIRQEAIGGGRALGNKLEEGSWLITGQDSMVKFLQQTAIPQKHELSGVLAGYDAINFTIKKFQTVFRASHHAGNLLSGLAQTRAAGAGWKNTVLGHLDAAQMVMGLGPEGRRLIGDLEAIYGAESSLKTVQGAVNRANLFEGALAGKTVDEFGMLDTGGQVYGMTDIVRVSAERNLFGGMQATQDIRLGGLDPQAAIRETERATATGLKGALETGVDIARLPEITARLSTVMALLREGHGLEDAIDMARLAHVDHFDLTKFERHGLKRAIPYYTFSRKYVPFALDRMAKDPSLIVGWQKAFENSDLLGIDEQGTPVLSYGTFEADIGRANANLDALMALAGTTEALTGMVGNPVQEVARPGFMSMSGGLASPVFAAVGLTQEQGASVPAGVQELWDSVFITRFVEGIDAAARGQGFQPLQDSALSWLFPANFTAEPEKARRFQVNMARRALSRLELQAQEAKTEAQLNSLRRQAEKIKSALRTVQEDF